ncbi:MAG: hypothetical protein ACRDFS_03680 [Chloroflexota bacterium]
MPGFLVSAVNRPVDRASVIPKRPKCAGGQWVLLDLQEGAQPLSLGPALLEMFLAVDIDLPLPAKEYRKCPVAEIKNVARPPPGSEHVIQ